MLNNQEINRRRRWMENAFNFGSTAIGFFGATCYAILRSDTNTELHQQQLVETPSGQILSQAPTSVVAGSLSAATPVVAGNLSVSTPVVVGSLSYEVPGMVKNNGNEYETILLAALIGISAGYLTGRCLWGIFSYLYDYLEDDETKVLKQENIQLRMIRNALRAQLPIDFKIDDDNNEYSDTEDTPNNYICPISLMVMQDPVYVEDDGKNYDRKSLQLWFNYNRDKNYCPCPISRDKPLADPRQLCSNETLKNEIRQYLELQKLESKNSNIRRR